MALFGNDFDLGASGTDTVPDAAWVRRGKTMAQIKSTSAWQAAQWRMWPRTELWPDYLTVYEAAALLRVSPDTIRRLIVADRNGRAALRHVRFGAAIRIQKADLVKCGVVQGR